MYLKIKKIKQAQTTYGNNLEISMVGLYDSDGKWIKRVALNDVLMDIFTKVEIQIQPESDGDLLYYSVANG